MGRTYQDVCEKLIGKTEDKKAVRDLKRDLLTLKRKGVNSFESLRELLLKPDPPCVYTAMRLLELFEKSRAVPVLLRLLQSGTYAGYAYAATTLTIVGGKLAARGCLKILSKHPDHLIREDVVYVLSFMFEQWEVIPALLQIFTDEQEPIKNRTQAAEGLGSILSFEYRRREYKQVGEALLQGLSQAAPEMRFWSAFGLNQMRYKKALAKLDELAESDKTLCPGWWTVGERAYDAAFYIRIGRGSGIERTLTPITQN